MSERFEKEKPTSGEYRRQVIYRGLRLLEPSANNQETQQKLSLSPVVTSYPVDFKDYYANTKSTGTLVTTSDNSQKGGENLRFKRVPNRDIVIPTYSHLFPIARILSRLRQDLTQ